MISEDVSQVGFSSEMTVSACGAGDSVCSSAGPGGGGGCSSFSLMEGGSIVASVSLLVSVEAELLMSAPTMSFDQASRSSCDGQTRMSLVNFLASFSLSSQGLFTFTDVPQRKNPARPALAPVNMLAEPGVLSPLCAIESSVFSLKNGGCGNRCSVRGRFDANDPEPASSSKFRSEVSSRDSRARNTVELLREIVVTSAARLRG